MDEGDILVSGITGSEIQLKTRIGHGGMGEVWLVHDKALDVLLAMKSPLIKQVDANGISDYLSNDKKYIENLVRKFYNETKSWLLLEDHPNIVNCYYADYLGGSLRIFLEYVDGNNLSNLLSHINQKWHLNTVDFWDYVLTIAIQVSDALAHAHSNGLIHRDLTSRNILVTDENSDLLQKWNQSSYHRFRIGKGYRQSG